MSAKPTSRCEHSRGIAVVAASPWRVRECRRQAAKERDKKKIEALSQHVIHLEWQIREWWQWYWKQSGSWSADVVLAHLGYGCGGSRVLNRDVVETKEEQNNKTEMDGSNSIHRREEIRKSGIDYLKWDHLEEYSLSDAKETEEKGEAEETEVENDVGADHDYFDYFDLPQGEPDANEKNEENHDDEVEIEWDAKGFDNLQDRLEDGELHNKEVCLVFLEQAHLALGRCFAKAAAATSNFDGLREALEKQERLCQQQSVCFAESMQATPATEFEDGKACQLWTLIAQWCDELMTNIHDLVQTCIDGG